jgi:hypothetical protein
MNPQDAERVVREITPQMLNNICRILFTVPYNRPNKYYITYYYVMLNRKIILTRINICGIYNLSILFVAA